MAVYRSPTGTRGRSKDLKIEKKLSSSLLKKRIDPSSSLAELRFGSY
jgi:hypothetical protein